MDAPARESGGRLAWLGPASCAAAALGLAGFFATTTLSFDLSYGAEHSSFGFNFASGMAWWYHVCLIALFLAGAALGVAGVRRAAGLRPLAWLGAVANAISAALLAVFLVLAVAQGAWR